MATYKIAHLREQGQDMIIVPLESSFGSKSDTDQSESIAALQYYARTAGLAGTVVAVWRSGSSHRFIAPPNWHAFFRTLSYERIIANLNKELTCS
jgi:hypothetical protein